MKRSTKRPAKRTASARVRRAKTADQRPLAEAAAMNPGLQGFEPLHSRYAGRSLGDSIEDPLYDWPEDGASEDDEWLLDREVEDRARV